MTLSIEMNMINGAFAVKIVGAARKRRRGLAWKSIRGLMWYKKDDTKLPLQIVPIILDDFIDLFETGFESGKLKPEKILQLLVSCRALSNRDASEWKKEISAEIKRLITRWK